MRLIVDQDEILCRWVDRILEWYNEDYKTEFTRHDVKNYWDMENILGPQGKPFIRSCIRYPELYRDLNEVSGAVKGMMKLKDLGHDVIIATAVPHHGGFAYHGKLEWLRRNMPGFPLNNFVAIQRKDLLNGDLLLDDGPHNIEAWNKTGRTSVVFDAPWNKECKATHRVRNWEEFVNLVETLSEKK